MEILGTKRFIPKGFELGATLISPNRSIAPNFWQVCCYEKLYRYGDLPFHKGCHQWYHNAVGDYKMKI